MIAMRSHLDGSFRSARSGARPHATRSVRSCVCMRLAGSGRLLVALSAALVVAGCAAGNAQRASGAAGPPASPAAGRSELVALEQRIERELAALGLRPERDLAEAVRLGERATRADSAGPALAPQASPAPPPAPAEASAKSDSAERTSGRAEDACGRDPCRYTRAICDAASRICEIARYLEEPDARARCGRALQDCQQARRSTRDRCPGC